MGRFMQRVVSVSGSVVGFVIGAVISLVLLAFIVGIVQGITADETSVQNTVDSKEDVVDNNMSGTNKDPAPTKNAAPAVDWEAIRYFDKAEACAKASPVIPEEVVNACANRDQAACLNAIQIEAKANGFMDGCLGRSAR